MRTAYIAVVFAVVLALAAFLIRIQPAGTATIFRSGERLAVRNTRVYSRVPGAIQCRARSIAGRLAFDSSMPVVSATDDELPVRVRFTYKAPRTVPIRRGAGDWCSLLAAHTGAVVSRASSQYSATDLLDRFRFTTDRIAGSLDADLRNSGIIATGVSVRADLPAGFARLRSIRAVTDQVKKRPPVIFVGLDGADWQLLDPYITSGVMPNLKGLVSSGARGSLETEHPPLSPLVWTTIVTGVSPLQHQILDFTRFNPYTHEKEPITSDERRAPAIWNMLTYGGKQSAVFGMWATYAAEPLHGINVSDRLFTFLYSDVQRPPGVVYPPHRQRWAEQEVTAAERAVDLQTMRSYLPSMTEAELSAAEKSENPYAEPSAALRRILVETEIYRRLSISYLRARTRLPDLTIVYFQGTDTIGHEFAPFAPPKQPQVSQADYDRYNAVPEKYFRHIDAILGEYMAIAQERGAVIVVASDHGFRWTEGRPTEISSTATATAAKWHRNQGIYVVSGASSPAVPKTIRQVRDALLDLTGLPQLDYSPFYRPADPPPAPSSRRANEEELAKLRALGYIGANEPTRSATPQNDTKTAGAFNNAGLILRNDRRTEEAIVSFERALTIDPRYASAMWNLSETLFESKRDLDRADDLVVAAMKNGLPDGAREIIGRAIAYQRSNRIDRSLRLLDSAVDAVPNDGEMRIFRGRYRMDRHDCAAALQDFQAAEQSRPDDAVAWASAGLAQMCLGHAAAARESFSRSLAIDPNQPMLRRFLAGQ